MFEEMIKELKKSVNECLACGNTKKEIYRVFVSKRDEIRDYSRNRTDSFEYCFGSIITKHFLEIKQREIAGEITEGEIKKVNSPATLNGIFNDLCEYVRMRE